MKRAWELAGRDNDFPPCTVGLRTIDKLRKVDLWSKIETTDRSKASFELLKKNCYSFAGLVDNLLSSSECDQLTKILETFIYPPVEAKITDEVEDYNDDEAAARKNQIRQFKKSSDLISRKLFLNQNIDLMENLGDMYDPTIRSGHRLVMLEEKLSQVIWDRIKNEIDIGEIFLTENISQCPRGFSVFPEENWKFAGLNSCIRVNLYEATNFFSYHQDSQYCPSSNERSLLTGIIYLNDDFTGGNTSCYFPDKCDCGKLFDENHVIPQVNVTSVSETIDSINNFEQKLLSIRPKQGRCLLLSPHLFHGGEKIEEGHKWILKFDIVVSRSTCTDGKKAKSKKNQEFCVACTKPLTEQSGKISCADCQGFIVHPFERKFYREALGHFRCAQNKELEMAKAFEVESEESKKPPIDAEAVQHDRKFINYCYEKCLLLRYSFPQALHYHQYKESQKASKGKSSAPPAEEVVKQSNSADYFSRVPLHIWEKIFDYAGTAAAKYFAHAFPIPVGLYRAEWERKRNEKYEKQLGDLPKFIPKLRYQFGYISCFEFQDAEYFKNNLHDCLRVCAFYAFSLLGQAKGEPPYKHNQRTTRKEEEQQSKYYTVRYDPENNSITSIPINVLLADVFYKRKAFGCIYSVFPSKSTPDPVNDFKNSVDRSFLQDYHERDFTGLDYQTILLNNQRYKLVEDHMYDQNIEYFPYLNVLGATLDKSLKEGYTHSLRKLRQLDWYDDWESYTGCKQALPKQQKDKVGCSLITNLIKPMDGFHCCPIGENENDIYWNTELRKINHLVFNFEEQDLIVNDNEENHTDFFAEFLLASYSAVCPESDGDPTIKHYSVNVASLLTSKGLGFNHASCNCYTPIAKFNVETFQQIRYPQLSEVCLSVIFTEENKALVFATYDGLASL